MGTSDRRKDEPKDSPEDLRRQWIDAMVEQGADDLRRIANALENIATILLERLK